MREPWRSWLAAAVALGLSPSVFWRLSLSEWRALTGEAMTHLLDRRGFEALAAQFPDETR